MSDRTKRLLLLTPFAAARVWFIVGLDSQYNRWLAAIATGLAAILLYRRR